MGYDLNKILKCVKLSPEKERTNRIKKNLYQGCEKGCASFCIRNIYVHTETEMRVYACYYAYIHV